MQGMMTKAQKIIAAQTRLEARACDLLEKAEKCQFSEGNGWSRNCQRKDVLEAAREYASALNSFKRAAR